jgi:hypothetical protein
VRKLGTDNTGHFLREEGLEEWLPV